MKVVFTDEAVADLDSISGWLTLHYPTIAPLVARRIQSVVAHLGRWPESARRVAGRPDVRTLPLGRYPYVIFYRVTGEVIEILHIHHAARER